MLLKQKRFLLACWMAYEGLRGVVMNAGPFDSKVIRGVSCDD